MNIRVRKLNEAPVRQGARYVLYWAQMNRRVEANHALEYALELANELKLPVLFYEGLTYSYPFANDRLHTFILEGVPDTQKALAGRGIGYHFYLQRSKADRADELYRLAADAAAVIADDYPTFVARQFNERVPAKIGVAYYAVDSSCVVPMACMVKREYAAYTIRPKIKKLLPEYLVPCAPVKAARKWTGETDGTPVASDTIARLVAQCDIDHSVKASLSYRGGAKAAAKHLDHFLEQRLRRYARDRNEPSKHATSGMSPYLHFGHINSLTVALNARDYAREHHLIADEFLEELIVRRELAFNHARFSDDPGSMSTLPDWARKTLAKHAADPRPALYTREQFETGATYDELWNATQKELLLCGKIHGYYRMYWGKKIVEWSATPEQAAETMIYLHDRYSLDGRDPNTYTNILWCLGLHDRPWGERPIFGMVRYMSLDGMKRKTDVAAYIAEIDEIDRTGNDPFRLE